MLASHKGEIPFVNYLIPFLAGVSLALSFGFSGHQTTLLVAFGILLAGFIGLNIFYQQAKLYRKQWVGGIMISVLLLLGGMLTTVNYDNRNPPTYFERYAANELLVKVNSEPQFKAGFLRFTAEAIFSKYKNRGQPVSGNILLTIRMDSAHASKISYGNVLLIPAKYIPVDPPFNPGEFNYKQYLAQQNIYAQAFLNPHDVRVAGKNMGNPVIVYSLQLRQHLVSRFKHYLHSPEAIAVASTLILGYKAELDNDILQAYSKTGTIHVLSVSGAHVAIIFALISLLLGFLEKYKYGRIFKAGLTIVLIWYYALLTGLSPAVCRAAVMISLIIIGKTYNRRINTLNLLAVAAFANLLVDPFLINDVGFQLSYLAVGGLVVFQPIIYNWLDIENKWLDKLWLLCSVSIAAQAITFPLSAYYFHQFPVYFLLSNLLILLPSFVIMYAGVGFLLMAQLGIAILAKPAAFVLEQTILWMDRGLQFIEHVPYASLGKLWITRMEFVLLLAMVILLFCLFYYKKSIYCMALCVSLLLFTISANAKNIDNMRSNTITFFNLKKHSTVLFKQGERAVLLTDLTDTDKAWRYSIQPCLDSNRINTLSVIPFTKDTSTAFFAKRGNLIRFLDKDVLLLDKSLQYRLLSPKLTVSNILILGSPRIKLDFVTDNYHYQTLVIDPSNTDKTVEAFKAGAANNDKNMYVLKRNKSLVLKSNK